MERCWLLLLVVACLCPVACRAASAREVILPQNRSAFYSSEAIELAVAGMAEGEEAAVEITPADSRDSRYVVRVEGDGSTVAVELPPYALAPGAYTVSLDGKATEHTLTISSGVNLSTMLLSQTMALEHVKDASGNFFLGSAFNFGLLDDDGQPLRDVRGHRSQGFDAFEKAIAANCPTLVYMYWTACLTHQAFSAGKSWTEPSVIEAMRLLNFHTAQRIRRYGKNIVSVGTMDEPGLGYGRTPAGGLASGFPSWDEQPWYEQRGWEFTNDPASRPADDWMKYMTIRCGVLGETMAQAKQDLKTVWPEVRFGTDTYAPHAVTDGPDPLNQGANDIVTTHVFMDFGYGKLGTIGAVFLEKAHDPAAKVAHAMNGQLFGDVVPQPQQREAYRLMLNCLLAAGLHSNWWLNTYGMETEDLAIVNEPGLRMGPLFTQMSPAEHDVAILWSFTEICMREKDVVAKEAHKSEGEQIQLDIAVLPENTAIEEGTGRIELTPYTVGLNYAQQVLTAHQALSRAGYPAHIVHEKLLPQGALRGYKTLVIVGQTFPLPGDVTRAIEEFQAGGGRVIVDDTTTVSLPEASVTAADFRDPYHRWAPLHIFTIPATRFQTEKEASYFQTNHFMDEQVRSAVAPIKATMATTECLPVFSTDSIHLAGEKHTGGEGALYMVINGYEELPEIGDDQAYWVYNYAPYTVTYSLQGIRPDSVVYCIEGADWRTVRRVADFAQPQTESFAPGEMKLYLVAPRNPGGLDLGVEAQTGAITVSVRLRDLQMPWPLTVRVTGPDGKQLYRTYRATDSQGHYSETFPIGSNAPAGEYSVDVGSPAGDLRAEAKVEVKHTACSPAPYRGNVRVVDGDAIREFLAGKPELAIALGAEEQRPIAEHLARALASGGVAARIVPEQDFITRVRYPRIWSPYIDIHQPTEEEAKVENMVVTPTIVKLESLEDGRVTAVTADGVDLGDEWYRPNTLATVGESGYIFSYWYDVGGEKFFAPGCKLYVDKDGMLVILNAQPSSVRVTEEVRQEWSRPWARLQIFGGGPWLCPALPEAYSVEENLILLGDSSSGELVAALQASELLEQVADDKYPGPGKALVSFAWSPFAVGRNVILIGAQDEAGLRAGTEGLLQLLY